MARTSSIVGAFLWLVFPQVVPSTSSMMDSGSDFSEDFSPLLTMGQMGADDPGPGHSDGIMSPLDLLEESSVSETKTLITKSSRKSGIWQHFQMYKEKEHRHLAYCLLCMQDVNYTMTKSIGMLQCHLKRKNWAEHDKDAVESAEKRLVDEVSTTSSSQLCIRSFVTTCPSFEKSLVKWIVKTYQPILTCEQETF